jgi:hypothetical protein
MTILTKPLRRQLETAIKQARDIAENAAKEAIARMGVAEAEAPAHLSDDNKALRRSLRAHARTLGDTRDTAGAMRTARLQEAASYEIWHRMLFGRFLAERGLLIHPELGAAISVAELRDLSKEEGAPDEWALAERYAAPGLPGVFKPDDPVLALPIAPEFSKRLRAALNSLPVELFTADDSLGWTYQFWRAAEKDAVNAAGGKIGATELPAATQLFTDSYMVKLLLHNTLGAWWAGKILAANPELALTANDEDELRAACALEGITWEFLRFVRDGTDGMPWRPAAGTFSGWPTRGADITYCDPCCGSGHFLVEALSVLTAIRRQEEGLSAEDAVIAVLQHNLHGLELDGRCVQIAAFNVALTAWKLAGAATRLPIPHIAWVGAPPPMSRLEMAALADDDRSLRRALEGLHDQFVQAPFLGSLLEVGSRDLLDVDLRERGEAALAMLRPSDAERSEGAFAAQGLLDATTLLARRYVLLATNVPFLGRGQQVEEIALFLENKFPDAKADLATAMLERMRALATDGGTVASVTPQNWLQINSYEAFRKKLLKTATVNVFFSLGMKSFAVVSTWDFNIALVVISNVGPDAKSTLLGVNLSALKGADEKALAAPGAEISQPLQSDQLRNPESRIVLQPAGKGPLFSTIAGSFVGFQNGDTPRWVQHFWENFAIGDRWVPLQLTTSETKPYSGRHSALLWEHGRGDLARSEQAYIKGREAWGKLGVMVRGIGNLPCSLYCGDLYDQASAAIIPKNPDDLDAIWAFCSSPEYNAAVRRIDGKLNVTNATLVKVPFDLAHWKSVATEHYPAGLPKPYSDDPTQWIFHGHSAFAEAGTELHVALACMAGYQWPAETNANMRLSELAKKRIALAEDLPKTDIDPLLLLHANSSKSTLADRMRVLLSAAFGSPLSMTREQALVRAADAKLDKKEARDATLEGWLSERAFRQHCILFQQRPFLWQVWDGMKEGFSAFVNYQRLDRALLDKLTYTVLGDWIRTAKAERQTARLERAEQLQQKLAKIIEGECPYDIFVRWKPLARQPLGWDPDLDDGVRLNIRPFMTAGILRDQPRGISWNKDRGTDVPSAPWFHLGPQFDGKPGDRINDHHTSLAEKRAARGTP